MENQDPLNTTDSTEFAQQLATFSGVEQAVLTNDLLTALTVQMNATGMAQMADWVGKDARAATPVFFNGSPVTLAPNPATVADKVELVVYDADGSEVQRMEIPKSADPVEWAGTDNSGGPFAAGIYQFQIESSVDGEVVLSEVADVYAKVQEVRSENGQSLLVFEGGITVNAASVTALRDA